MGLFPFFRRKKFFTPAEQERMVEAIRAAEKETSGEIRVYIESKNPMVNPVDRAAQVFYKLQMQHTEHRNGVLLYIATQHRELALFGDEGIYKATGAGYWDTAVKNMISRFNGDDICEGVVQCIRQVGETLKVKFPYMPKEDKNELPDEIVFGD
ncbi:MAG: TPM domain-containing protein [Ferruginibacter sp.]